MPPSSSSNDMLTIYAPPPKCTIPSSTLTIPAVSGGHKEEGRKNPLRFFKGGKRRKKGGKGCKKSFPPFFVSFRGSAASCRAISLVPGQTSFAPKVLLFLFFQEKKGTSAPTLTPGAAPAPPPAVRRGSGPHSPAGVWTYPRRRSSAGTRGPWSSRRRGT